MGVHPTAGAGYGAGQTARRDVVWSAALIASALLFYLPGNSFGSARLAPDLAALAPLGLALLGLLCYLRTELAVTLLPLSIPLYMLPRHVGAHLEFSLSEVLILLCAAAVALRLVTGWPHAAEQEPDHAPAGRTLFSRSVALVPATRFWAPLALFVVAALVATALALFRSVALRELRVVVIEPALYFALVVVLLRTPVLVTRALYAAIGAAVIVGIIALAQLAFPSLPGLMGADGAPTMYGVYPHRNNLGLLLDRALPMALALTLWSRRPRRVLGACATAELAVVLLLTPSRGAWLTAAVVCAAVVALWAPRVRVPVLLGGLLGVLLLVLAELHPTGALGRLVSLGHGASSQARVYVWQSALRMARDHPIVGVGPDNFLYYYSAWGFRKLAKPPALPAGWVLPSGNSYLIPGHSYMSEAGHLEPFLSHPHNIVLDVWLSTGLLGLAALAWLLGLFFIRAHRAVVAPTPNGQTREALVPVVMASASVLALLVHGLVDNSYFVPDLAMLFWLAVAAVAVVDYNQSRPDPRPPMRESSLAGTGSP